MTIDDTLTNYYKHELKPEVKAVQAWLKCAEEDEDLFMGRGHGHNFLGSPRNHRQEEFTKRSNNNRSILSETSEPFGQTAAN